MKVVYERQGKINTKMDFSPAYLPCLPFVFCIAGVPASARSCFSVAASLFYFALLHKKVGLANLKACQAEVFSPKKRSLEYFSIERRLALRSSPCGGLL